MIVEIEKGEKGVIDRKIILKDNLPHCKNHGSMIKVTPNLENNFSIWRCPICHIGCLFDGNLDDIHYGFFNGEPRKYTSKDFENVFFKLQSFMSKNKIGFRVLGLSSLYLQGFDVLPNTLEIEVNKQNLEKVKGFCEEFGEKIKIFATDKTIEKFEAESIKEIKERLNNDEELKQNLIENKKYDAALERFFGI